MVKKRINCSKKKEIFERKKKETQNELNIMTKRNREPVRKIEYHLRWGRKKEVNGETTWKLWLKEKEFLRNRRKRKKENILKIKKNKTKVKRKNENKVMKMN